MPHNAFDFPLTQGFGPTTEPLDGPYGGYPNFNKGYDYGAPMGTDVPALASGTVVSAGDSKDGWGLSVKVRDAQGFIHNYGHLSGINVRPGDTVQAGQLVGAVGNTGLSTGPHLSYDVFRADTGEFVDPAPWTQGQATPADGAPQPDRRPPLGPNGEGLTDRIVAQIGTFEEQLSANPDMAILLSPLLTSLYGRLIDAYKLEGRSDPIETAIAQGKLDQQKFDNELKVWELLNASIPDKNYANQLNAYKENRDNADAMYQYQQAQANRDTARAQAELDNLTRWQEGRIAQNRGQVEQSVANVNRSISGYAEARQRANLLTSGLSDLAARALPAGTAYTPGLEPTGAFAQAMGRVGTVFNAETYRLGDGATNPTGGIRISPEEILARQDAALGVTGPLPPVAPWDVRDLPEPSPIPRYEAALPDFGAPPAPPQIGSVGLPALPRAADLAAISAGRQLSRAAAGQVPPPAPPVLSPAPTVPDAGAGGQSDVTQSGGGGLPPLAIAGGLGAVGILGAGGLAAYLGRRGSRSMGPEAFDDYAAEVLQLRPQATRPYYPTTPVGYGTIPMDPPRRPSLPEGTGSINLRMPDETQWGPMPGTRAPLPDAPLITPPPLPPPEPLRLPSGDVNAPKGLRIPYTEIEKYLQGALRFIRR